MASDFVPVEGQFDDADEESAQVFVPGQRNIEVHIIENQKVTKLDAKNIANFTYKKSSNGANVGYEDEDDEEEEEDDEDTDSDVPDNDYYRYEDAALGKDMSSTQSGSRIANSSNKTVEKVTNYQPSLKHYRKFEDKINLHKYEPVSVSHSIRNVLDRTERKMEAGRIRVKDKSDRATVEQVLDPRTRMILFKLLNRGIIEEINGCISTGKEANVYHATCKDGKDKAIKIYKTSILTFKDREKYVSGEFRFRHGFCRSNPRKMVRTWAEKEMRNLVRIHKEGVLCPEPYLLRSHVLVMEFIGEEGIPAPLLKDVPITESKARELYLDCILMMRRLYNDCHLVHADLSEFNILYHEGKPYFIDVSQSVEHDHPRALVFLRKDCTNINEYFRKKGVPTLTTKELFDFVVDPTITAENIDDYLDRSMEIASKRSLQDLTNQEKVDDEVFKSAYIPQRLDHVIDHERDIYKIKDHQKASKGPSDKNCSSTGENDVREPLIYETITALKSDLSGPQIKPRLLENAEKRSCEKNDEAQPCSSSSGSESSDESDSDRDYLNAQDDAANGDGTCEGDELKSKFKSGARPRDESPESRRVSWLLRYIYFTPITIA